MKHTNRYAILAVVISIAWLFAVIFGYYIVHKPFGAENAFAILNAAGDVVVAAALATLGAAVGSRLLKRVAFRTPLESIVFAAGVGLGLCSFATLALGLGGLLQRELFWALLVAGLFVMRREAVALARRMRAVDWQLQSSFERFLAAFTLISLLIALLFALAPPVAWDAQTYHLVEAKVALAQGRITAPPDILYFSFPSLVEMLFLAAMTLKGDVAAQLLHWQFLLLSSGAVLAFGARFFNARVAWLSCALLVAVPSLLTISTYAYVDLGLLFCTFAAFYAILAARETLEPAWFALAGMCAGFAMGVKYTAAIVPVALFTLLLLSAETRRRSVLRGYGAFLLCSFVFALPWYLRNLVFTGNPVYPFVFGGPYWDAFRGNWFGRFGTGMLNTPLAILTAPWDATILGREGELGYEATIGPLILALVPLLLFLRSRRDEPRVPVRELAVFAGILYAFWLAGIAGSKLLWQTRLLFPAFPVLALLAALAFDRLAQLDLKQFSLQRFARLVVLLVLGLTALNYLIGFGTHSTLPYLLGAETRDDFLARSLQGYGSALGYVNSNLPSSAKVLFLWEPRVYYARRAVQPDAILDGFMHLYSQHPDAAGAAAALCQAGYTHVLVNRAGLDYQLQSGYDPISDGAIRELTDLEAHYLRQVYGKTSLQIETRNGRPGIVNAQQDPYAVYEIVPPGAD